MISNALMKKFIGAVIALLGVWSVSVPAYEIKVTNRIGDDNISVYAGNPFHSDGKELDLQEISPPNNLLKNQESAKIYARPKRESGSMKFKGAFTLFLFDGSSPYSSAWCRIKTARNVPNKSGFYTHNHENHGDIHCYVEGGYTNEPIISVERPPK